MKEKLRWVQVSDFHFVAAGDVFSQRVACRALLDDIRERIREGESVDFVLVTGDIAFSGQGTEYAKAEEFLSELAAALQVAQDHFFFVPGNHDVDRTRSRLAFEGACATLNSQADVDELLGSPTDLAPLIDRQAAYNEFVDNFVGEARLRTEDGLAQVVLLTIGDLRLSILCLNSAWMSGRNAEESALVIGERQVINALDVASPHNPHFQIAMAHHPISWLKEWDQSSCNVRLLPGMDFYQRGHLHLDEVALSSTPESPCLSIAAGSGHATRFYANSYNIIELDIGAGECVVRPFRYDPDGNAYSVGPEVVAAVRIGGSIRGTPSEFAECLEAWVPDGAAYSDYMWDLIQGRKTEVPFDFPDGVDFYAPTVAEAALGHRIAAVDGFMRLPNLLRLYDDDVPMSVRVRALAPTIRAFVDYLAGLAAIDGACRDRVCKVRTPGRSTHDVGTEQQSFTSQFLITLREQAQWILLKTQARRFIENSDSNLAMLAKRYLAEALLHSDQTDEREEGVSLTRTLAGDPDASPEDFLLAAAGCEVLGRADEAIDFAQRALERWPEDVACRLYVRDLATRTGSLALRRALDAIQGGRL